MNYVLKRNPLADGDGGSPWVIYSDNEGQPLERAFATDEDLAAIGTTEDERDEARRGYEVVCSTVALDAIGDIFLTRGY